MPEKKRRHAQIGLFAAVTLLVACLSVLFVQDFAQARGTEASDTQSAPAGSSTVSAVTPKF